MTITDAVAELTTAFNDPRASIGEGTAEPFVIASWPSVPSEIIRAAGLRPLVARGAVAATPAADVHLEVAVFPNRLRHLIDAALAGRLADAACIVIARTSDADYKSFLYLREFARTGTALPPVVLFDLVQSRGRDSRAYVVARTRALADMLGSLSGRALSDDDLRREIARSNAARTAARRLSALRRGNPHINGTEVFPLLGAFWQMAPERYAALAGIVADHVETRAPLDGPRVLLAGVPLDTPTLHAAIESHGATVVAEIGPWGNDSAGDDVPIDDDPIAALVDKYRNDAIGARTPVAALRAHIERHLDGTDAVVVSLPPEDAVFGWDYPALRDVLHARRIPHVCVRADPYRPLSSADHSRLASLVAAATPLHTTRHG